MKIKIEFRWVETMSCEDETLVVKRHGFESGHGYKLQTHTIYTDDNGIVEYSQWTDVPIGNPMERFK